MSNRIPAYEGSEPFIFVSYAHKNSAQVLPIIEALFADKYRLWYDEGIPAGSEWPRNIEEHLRAAAATVVFVSKESLASPNCENEVANAGMGQRPVYEFILDENTHPKLKDCPQVKSYDELKKELNDFLIGDGVVGYTVGTGVVKKGNFWTAIIAVAVGLIVALAVGIYGLNAGWFDSLLPGLATEEVVEEQSEVVQMESNVITRGIEEQTKSYLTGEITFTSEETKNMLYDAIHYFEWSIKEDITYDDLTTCNMQEVCFQEANDAVLEFMQCMPQLKTLRIESGTITTLEPLMSCSNLESVYIASEVFPIATFPENASFTVVLF